MNYSSSEGDSSKVEENDVFIILFKNLAFIS